MSKKKNVCILVLGEILISPRMQYHALSLAKTEKINHVDIIGYMKHKPLEEIDSNKKIKCHKIRQFPAMSRKLFLLYMIPKVLFQILQLFYMLFFKVKKPDFLFIQNPPTIPTMIVARIFCWIRKTKYIIDWHNFGYSILALHFSKKNFLVKIAKWVEYLFSRGAYAHFCVTKAMQKELKKNWKINNAIVLYDKPKEFFHETSIDEKHELFQRIKSDLVPLNKCLIPNTGENLFTELVEEKPILKKTRPALVISSTSWTKDDNFEMLVEAAEKLEEKIIKEKMSETFPNVLITVTGKGPLKEEFQKNCQKKKMQKIGFSTVWLEAKDYPLLLGSGDVGVSLHESSSGFDLPIKVVDMFGCNLPVCAVDFNCLNELVQNDVTGLIFNSADQLADSLFLLLKDFPNNTQKLDSIRQNIRNKEKIKWSDSWNSIARKVFVEKVD
ncbi:chitobiosyldiphosphodolichol beta-mannosyltransferase [Anaeramoeba ignava]|uniref:Beta-1,4-mannosyltransferase n=1 Tax=Anaeramoeba ignava TaxID=1746090 RepID=A0A9Q0R6J2_ANAIG|nr:chitobiosyldiphosphodolichol beta-mannosyltransferase [Anaeramoeba ignava]